MTTQAFVHRRLSGEGEQSRCVVSPGIVVSGWCKSILDGGYSGASFHISLDMNLRLRSTCQSSPFGFSFLISFVLLPATSISVRWQHLSASLHLNRLSLPLPQPDSSISFRLALFPAHPFLSFCFPQKTTKRCVHYLNFREFLFSACCVQLTCNCNDGIFEI